jgi:hypothetical protein
MPLMSVVDTAQVPKHGDVTTRAEILARFLRLTGLGLTGTCTNGDDTSIIDTTRLRSGQYDPEDYEGAWVRISTTTDGLAPVGEIRLIEKYLPSEGRFEVSPRFTVAVGVNDTYQVFRYPDPQDVLDHLDDILIDDGKFPTLAFATDLPDGDMEASDLSAWTVEGTLDTASGATEKRDLVTDRIPMTGKRYLRTKLTSPNTSGYVESAAMGVNPGMTLHLSALVQTNDHANAVAKISIWDKTNNVELDSAEVTRQLGIARLRIQDQLIIPSTTRSVSVRLTNQQLAGQTGHVNFDDVVFYALGSRDIWCPSWVRSPRQVKRIYRHVDSGGFEKSVGNVLVPESFFGYDTPDWVAQDEAFGIGYTKLVSATSVTSEPLYFLGLRHEEAYANDTEEKYIDMEYILAKLVARVYASLVNIPNAGSYNIEHIAQQASFYEEKARRKEVQLEQRIVKGLPRQAVSLTRGRPLGTGAARVITR